MPLSLWSLRQMVVLARQIVSFHPIQKQPRNMSAMAVDLLWGVLQATPEIQYNRQRRVFGTRDMSAYVDLLARKAPPMVKTTMH